MMVHNFHIIRGGTKRTPHPLSSPPNDAEGPRKRPTALTLLGYAFFFYGQCLLWITAGRYTRLRLLMGTGKGARPDSMTLLVPLSVPGIQPGIGFLCAFAFWLMPPGSLPG